LGDWKIPLTAGALGLQGRIELEIRSFSSRPDDTWPRTHEKSRNAATISSCATSSLAAKCATKAWENPQQHRAESIGFRVIGQKYGSQTTEKHSLLFGLLSSTFRWTNFLDKLTRVDEMAVRARGALVALTAKPKDAGDATPFVVDGSSNRHEFFASISLALSEGFQG